MYSFKCFYSRYFSKLIKDNITHSSATWGWGGGSKDLVRKNILIDFDI